MNDTADGRLVSKRRKEMAKWAVENFQTWPARPDISDADPDEIGCELVFIPGSSSLPVLCCRFGGGCVDSTVFFYAQRGAAIARATGDPRGL